MSIAKDWLKVSPDIEIARSQADWNTENSISNNLIGVQPGDLLLLKLFTPRKYLIAIDTGVKPRPLSDQKSIILAIQVDWVYQYPTVYTWQCSCYNAARREWYQLEMTFKYQRPFNPELKFTAALTPPRTFGRPLANIKRDITACCQEMAKVHT